MLNNKTYSTHIKSLRRLRWPWLWLIAFVGGLVFVVREIYVQQENPLQLIVLHRPIAIIIIGVFMASWVLKNKPIKFSRFMAPLILFSLWQLISTLWSIAPLWTFYRSVEYLVIVTLTVYTAASLKNLYEVRKWMNLVWIWIGILLVSAWVGIIFSPEKALISMPKAALPIMLSGVFPRINANSISHMAGILAIVGFCRLLEQKRRSWLILILLGIATMILSQGRSGLAGFIIGLLMVLMLYRRTGMIFTLATVICTLIITINFDTLFVEYFRRGQPFASLVGFSGRLYFWEYAWNNFIINSPVLGYGAFAGARFLAMPEITGLTAASSTHSSWIELLVNVGFIGTFIFLTVIMKTWSGLLSNIRKPHAPLERFMGIETLAVLTVLLVRSLFTTALIEHNQYAFFVAVGVLEFLRRSRFRQRQ